MSPVRAVSTLLLLFLAAPLHAQLPVDEYFEHAFPGTTFTRPVALTADPSGSGWLFVLEQAGTVKTFDAQRGSSDTHVVLDIEDRVIGYDIEVESGLLGLALHPEYDTNGYIYVYYMTDAPGAPHARLSRFTTSGTPAVADLDSELVLIELVRPDLKHNAGDLHFGPDGYLYAALGDGGCCGDPFDNGQDRTNLFSTIIRIDVDGTTGDLPYAIPPDNPYVGNTEGWREEIWAYGLRNPWRFSFHPETDEIWVGDVGELDYEEINRIVPGGNYGWSVMEGPDCFEWPPGSGQGTNCDPEGLILPVWFYGRDVGVSVTGGYVYRGERAPAMEGRYIFADWGFGRIFAATLDQDGQEVINVETLFTQPGFHPSAFGEDAEGELYMLEYFSGIIFRFREGLSGAPEPPGIERAGLALDGPNPSRGQTALRIYLPAAAAATVELYDLLGRRVSTILEDQKLSEGVTRMNVATEGLAPGVYIARLWLDGAAVGSVKLTIVH